MNDLGIIKELEVKGIKLTEKKNYTLENDKVIELRIICTNINDSIFKIICQLKNLKYLELRSTDDISEIPNEISNLSKLEYLNLDNNKITNISSEISKLISLKILILSRNDLTYFPNSLSTIISLEKLDLSSNEIASIPIHISKLVNLKYLNLAHNKQKQQLSNELSKLKKLEEIDLYGNELKNIPTSLFQLNHLKELDLRENLIEIIPNEISELTQLEKLDLSSNKIKKLPNSLFELKNLKILLLGWNKIDKIPTEFYKLEKLEKLNLGNNKIIKFPKKIESLISDFNSDNLIKRFFYPIGHGAFYAEKHKYHNISFTIVYDCGSRSGEKTVQPIIEKAFEQDEVIDILFISHFDADHVNKIKLLKNRTKIKQVIMPLLQEKEISFLVNIYRVLKINILTLLRNPEQFFGKETKIIRVKPSNEERPIENREVVNIEDIPHNSEIESGMPLNVSNNDLDWVFIPYNHKHIDRQKELEKLLKKRTDLDIDKLRTDADYTLDMIIKDDTLVRVNDKNKKKIKNKIKNIYDEVDGKINQNSMLLYSGILNFPQSNLMIRSFLYNFEDLESKFKELYPEQDYEFEHNREEFERYLIFQKYRQLRSYTHRVSCLYTGDTELKDVKPKIHFSQFWDSIGTIQIPHHGSVKNLDKSILDNNVYMCPMSVSAKSLKGHHPSKKVVDDIYSQDSYPILVTKKLNSGFVECISFAHYLGIYKKTDYYSKYDSYNRRSILEECNRKWKSNAKR